MDIGLLDKFKSILHSEDVITDYNQIVKLSSDLNNIIPPPQYPFCILRPNSIDQLSYIVQIASAYKIPLVVRGAGTTSSGGLSLDVSNFVMIDMRLLDQIEEINEKDMYVTVQAGCTWEKVYKELKIIGFRPTCCGFGDGLLGTIGGSASDNNLLAGYQTHGMFSNNILSMDIVLSNGSILETGSAAADGRVPFLRDYGPDLTGLFIGDAGALGIKARVSFKIARESKVNKFLSFSFKRIEDLVSAQVELARSNINLEHWGIDTFNNSKLFGQNIEISRTKNEKKIFLASSISQDLAPGVRSFSHSHFFLNIMIGGNNVDEVRNTSSLVIQICNPFILSEVENNLGYYFENLSFGPLRNDKSKDAFDYVATNSLFPLSRAEEIAAITDEYFIRHCDIIKNNNISYSYLTSASKNSFFIEPRLWWRVYENDKKNNKRILNIALELSRDLSVLWDTFGALHFQIGRFYNFENQLSTAARSSLELVKSVFDPNYIMNPGVLGLVDKNKVRKSESRYPEFPQDLLDDQNDVI